MLADGIRSSFADLFAINVRANELSAEEVKNKLRTLYAGKKTDLVISNIAKTFRALCDYADFSGAATAIRDSGGQESDGGEETQEIPVESKPLKPTPNLAHIRVAGLQYHINIVLPDTRDQAVYDAIFKSLREHLS